METIKFYCSLVEKHTGNTIDSVKDENILIMHVTNLLKHKEIDFEEKVLICNMSFAGIKTKRIGFYPGV